MEKRRKLFLINNVLCFGAAVLMATTLRGSHPGVLRWIELATPYTCLFSLWFGFRAIYKRSDDLETQLEPTNRKPFWELRQLMETQTMLAIGGLATALAVGWSLGHR